MSTASEPELQKNTRLRSPGASAATRLASSNDCGWANWNGRRVVEFLGLALDRGDDRIAVMAGIGAPQARGAVEHGAALGREIVHVLGARDQPRRALEGAVRA